MRQRVYWCCFDGATRPGSWFVYRGDTCLTRLRRKAIRIQVFESVPSRDSTRALDMEYEQLFEGVDDIILTLKMAERRVIGVQVVREDHGQAYVISALLSSVW